MYKRKIKSIKQVLINSFGNSELKYTFLTNLIAKDWPEIIGEPLCRFTKPVYLYQNILHISCLHNGIIQNLNRETSQILAALNTHDYNYPIKGIKFIPASYRKK